MSESACFADPDTAGSKMVADPDTAGSKMVADQMDPYPNPKH